MRSSQQHLFSHVPSTNIQRSQFNRSHTHKTTFNEGYLIPFYIDEVLPGDTFNVHVSAFARLTTPIVPILDNIHMDFFFFFVPNRLLWTNWQKFCGEQVNPGDSIAYSIPICDTSGGFTAPIHSLSDYFGIPTGVTLNNATINALPYRAYNLIYNEWFRDENLINSQPKNVGDGPDLMNNYVLQKRGKRHDYFTSCLPWPQKGTAVNLPLGSAAPIKAFDQTTGLGILTPGDPVTQRTLTIPNASLIATVTGANTTAVRQATLDNAKAGIAGGLFADLTNATAATINSLRQAFQIQKLLERDARGGTRYTEILRSHFGVISPDARLQRPEFLGGGSTPININPVVQTSSTGITGGASPQGHLAAFGTVTSQGIGFVKSFVEHGYVIGLLATRADITYQQGLHKLWTRRTRYDFYWPAFANLGEQAVLNKEIYYQDTADDANVFGYQERWAEYRYFPGKITGQMRSTAATPLDVWHLAQKFTAMPTLNQTFIEESAPMSRVVAVTTEPHFYFDSLITIKAARPMPTYSVPGLIDHF